MAIRNHEALPCFNEFLRELCKLLVSGLSPKLVDDLSQTRFLFGLQDFGWFGQWSQRETGQSEVGNISKKENGERDMRKQESSRLLSTNLQILAGDVHPLKDRDDPCDFIDIFNLCVS